LRKKYLLLIYPVSFHQEKNRKTRKQSIKTGFFIRGGFICHRV
jgi:hypothetical protein